MNEVTLSNDLAVITAQIKSYEEAGNYLLWEIGRRLIHVKDNDLSHGQFGKWLEEINMNQNIANRYMKIVRELDGKYDSSHNLGFQNLYAIASLPEEERSLMHETSKGELKLPDEMTVRELQELKKELKAKDQQISNLAETVTELSNKEPKIIEKTKEVVPNDYLQLKKEIERLEAENRELGKSYDGMMKLQEERIKKSQKYDELERSMAQMQGKMNRQQEHLAAMKEMNKLFKEADDFLALLAPISYSHTIKELEKDSFVIEKTRRLVNEVRHWCNDMDEILSNKNILEGEIINE